MRTKSAPSRVTITDGSTLFTHSPHTILEHIIDRARRRGDQHVSINGRRIALDRILRVEPPQETPHD